ncbi:MAG: radical SAM protein [Streptococcus thermophilus]
MKKVVINISNSCNLSCSYCYADGGNYGMDNRIMDLTTADNIIQEIASKGVTQINRLILFGGEPFLNIELFIYFIEKLSTLLNVVKIKTVTNGTVLNKRVKEMLVKFHPYLTISLDGPEIVHDRLRGRGSHRKTLRFINYLKNIDYENFEIASTYTRLHQKNGLSREDIFQYFTDMDVHFNINDVFTKNKVLIVKEMEKSLAERKQFIDKSIQHVINNNEKAFISPILYDVLISMIYKSTNRTFCDDIDPSNTLTYDVDGSKKLCFRFWGTHNSPKAESFNNKDNFEKCKNCWCRGMCLECVANVIDGYSSVISEDGEFLECSKPELMEYCIKQIIYLSKDREKLSRLVNNFRGFIRYA